MANGDQATTPTAAEETVAPVERTVDTAVEEAFPGENQEFKAVFQETFQNLGQGPNAPPPIVAGATKSLAKSFAQRIQKQTGQIPTTSQIREFVAGNLSPAFAERFIIGINPDQITAQFVDPVVKGREQAFTGVETTGVTDPEERLLGLREQLGTIFGIGRERLKEQVAESFGGAKRRVASDLAAQGLLRQPTS